MKLAKQDSLSGRTQHHHAILGSDAYRILNTSRLLIVGSGGIGCELLKNLVLSGFNHCEVVDLDTIDISNLNRQFLFQRQHVGRSKAHVARGAVLAFNNACDIVSYHSNIKDATTFGLSFFETFDLVFNALDNVDARRYVNQMCLVSGVPLIESGTAGYLGQVTPIITKKCQCSQYFMETECFDCQPKSPPKSYPVCTIRSTPTQPVHCVVWAKDYLFSELFIEEVAADHLTLSNSDLVETKELAELQKEAEELHYFRSKILDMNQDIQTLIANIFNQVFDIDVQRLVNVSSLWVGTKNPPIPLPFSDPSNIKNNGVNFVQAVENWKSLFVSSFSSLITKQRNAETIIFDKDDDDCLDFITSAANLRAHIFQIEKKTRFEIKAIAGNIIPAVASTNAIIAGFMVLQAVRLLTERPLIRESVLSHYVVRGGHRKSLFVSEKVPGPNPACSVCQRAALALRMSLKNCLLKSIVAALRRYPIEMQYPTISHDQRYSARLLFDSEFDENCDSILTNLNIQHDDILVVIDEAHDENRLTLRIINDEALPGENVEIISFSTIAKNPPGKMDALGKKRKRSFEDIGIQNSKTKYEIASLDESSILISDQDDD